MVIVSLKNRKEMLNKTKFEKSKRVIIIIVKFNGLHIEFHASYITINKYVKYSENHTFIYYP